MLRVLFRSGGRRPRLIVLGVAFLVLAVVLALVGPEAPVPSRSP